MHKKIYLVLGLLLLVGSLFQPLRLMAQNTNANSNVDCSEYRSDISAWADCLKTKNNINSKAPTNSNTTNLNNKKTNTPKNTTNANLNNSSKNNVPCTPKVSNPVTNTAINKSNSNSKVNIVTNKTNTNANSIPRNSNVTNANKVNKNSTNKNSNTVKNSVNSSKLNNSNFSSWLTNWAKNGNTSSKPINNSNATNVRNSNGQLCITNKNGVSNSYINANSTSNPYANRAKANCTFANVKLNGQGSDKYPMTGAEPPMTLSLINGRASVKYTNCYGYAVNSWGNVQDEIRKGLSTNSDGSYKPQPGEGNGYNIFDNFNWSSVNTAVIKDGLKPVSPNAKCEKNNYKVFGYMTNDQSEVKDYHWVIQNRPGMDGKVKFSHKPGINSATDRDSKGRVITDPLAPGLLHYRSLKYDFAQAYCVPCNLWIDPVKMSTIMKKPVVNK
jgi:hypothetical protein